MPVPRISPPPLFTSGRSANSSLRLHRFLSLPTIAERAGAKPSPAESPVAFGRSAATPTLLQAPRPQSTPQSARRTTPSASNRATKSRVPTSTHSRTSSRNSGIASNRLPFRARVIAPGRSAASTSNTRRASAAESATRPPAYHSQTREHKAPAPRVSSYDASS